MAAEGHAAPTAGEYIVHHLTHANGRHGEPHGPFDLSVFNFDSLFFSITLGVLACLILWMAARKATPGVPGRFQAAVELLVEMVENQAKGIVHNAQSRKLVAPLALTVFLWIFLMNAMDLLPVDLLPWLWQKITGDEHAYLRVVPTADLSITMGLSVGVLLVCIIYNIKIKGAGGWVHELFTAPFGTLDFNISFDLTDNFALSIEGVNLTSESLRQYGRDEKNLVFAQELKPRYLLGARYRF